MRNSALARMSSRTNILLPVAAVVLTAVAVTRGVFTAAVLALVVLIVGTTVWNIRRSREGRDHISAALAISGYDILSMEPRYYRLGAFSLWDTSRTQFVYRISVCENSTRSKKVVWARWGRSWYTQPDRLDLKWEIVDKE